MNRRTDGDGRWTEGDRLIQLINNVVCKLQRPELGREGGGGLTKGKVSLTVWGGGGGAAAGRGAGGGGEVRRDV